ncbi:MAG: hypothetical protein ACR2QH_07745 [Geminicoccaceae bacterium]
MTSDNVLKITREMSEDEILQACAEAVLESSPDDVRKQLDLAATERGCPSTLDLVKSSMKEERDQYDTFEGWLATLPGRLN